MLTIVSTLNLTGTIKKLHRVGNSAKQARNNHSYALDQSSSVAISLRTSPR
jgi:hypothetical protein